MFVNKHLLFLCVYANYYRNMQQHSFFTQMMLLIIARCSDIIFNHQKTQNSVAFVC